MSLAMPGIVLFWDFNDNSSIDARFVASCLSCISSNFDFSRLQTRDNSVTVTIYYVISIVGGSLILTTIINATIAFKVGMTGGKVGQGVPRRTMRVLGCVAWLFIVSYLPIVIYSIWSTADSKPPHQLHTLVNCSIGFSVCCNPIIHVISNKKFRRSVTSRLSVVAGPILG